MKFTSRLAIVPARIGSKRIKQKNIKKIGSKALIEYTLDTLKKSKLFDTIHVSTDSKKIEKLIKKNKLDFNFMRPKNLSGDKIPISSVIRFVINSFKKLNKEFDEVWLVYASNPFISVSHLRSAYKLYNLNKGKYSIMSVSNYNYPIKWALSLSKKNKLKPINPRIKNLDNNIVCEAGMFVIYQKNFFRKKKLIYKGYKIPIWDTVDIDTIDDFIMAKKLLK